MAWSRSDDLDGSPAQQHTFGFEGQMYTIDLGEANLAKLRKALQPFLTVAQPYGEMPVAPDFGPAALEVLPEPTPAPRAPARRTSNRKSATRKSSERELAEKAGIVKPVRTRTKAKDNRDFAMIRQWANLNGYTVGSTGRVPQAVIDAFDTDTPAA